jgi:hypothetical protein
VTEPQAPEREPVTLEQIQAAYAAYARKWRRPNPDADQPEIAEEAASWLLDVAMPQLLAELLDWRRLKIGGNEYAVTFEPTPPDEAECPIHLPEKGARQLADEAPAGLLWGRTTWAGPWLPLPDNEPPF